MGIIYGVQQWLRGGVLAVLGTGLFANAAVLQVGPTRVYRTPCAAIQVAASGDEIAIDPALYQNDFCLVRASNLWIHGSGGIAVMEANVVIPNGKGILVNQGHNNRYENIEFRGATVADRNGAGIRHEGSGLTVRNCYFHHNENGILSGALWETSDNIVIEHSEFAFNGAGDGQSHNLYIGRALSLTFRFNYSHDSNAGHLLKARAHSSAIHYNKFASPVSTNASYEINLPNAGRSTIIGNLIHQAASSGNSGMISYGEEGGALTGEQQLHVINNSFVNERSPGGIFVRAVSPVAAIVQNNAFAQVDAGTVQCAQAGCSLSNNYAGSSAVFVNPDRNVLDLRLKDNATALINMGLDPGAGLRPLFHYAGRGFEEARPLVAGIYDIGAYELATPIVTPPTLTAFTLQSGSVLGGASVTATVTLSAPTTVDTTIALTSNQPNVAQVPSTVTVLANRTSADFTVTTSTVVTDTTALLTATLNGVVRSSSLLVQAPAPPPPPPPPPPSPSQLASLTLAASSAVGGESVVATVTLSAPAPAAGVTVQLTSSNPRVAAVSAPSVLISAGGTSATFLVKTKRLKSDTSVTISASHLGVTKSAVLTVRAP